MKALSELGISPSAAPELYECLSEAVNEECKFGCGKTANDSCEHKGFCFVQKWRKALAKASGEE